MNDDKDKKAPEGEEERTVFMPGSGAPAPDASPGSGALPPDHDGHLSDPEPPPIEPEKEIPAVNESPEPAEPAAPEEEPRTIIAPSDAPAFSDPPPAAIPAAAEPAAPSVSGIAAAIVPREAKRGIEIGDVLNHIFEVKAFIGRGGMGEVFEGCNVNTDERVAIKVMLPAMAADEKIVALFRKEAKTLTKLQHEALVSYRVLAQEPDIGVLYIVTEFVEGVELAEQLGKVERTPEELAGLLRRLASGLAHAHRLGAIHRDLSPDNVLLPGGDVHEATIIDFGIAKDLNAGSATIVGDGFAGKLNYVAPEQLGDYGRDVGPWTDVYSLGLVMLAVAQGKPVDMSGSLVDAIDKRRKGPDLSAVPRSLRFLLEDMLKPDPKERIRSMDEVLARLGAPSETIPPTPTPPVPPPPPPPTGTQAVAAPPGGGLKVALVIGVIVAALLAAAAAWYAFGGLGGDDKDDGNEIVPDNRVVPQGDPVAAARNAINSALPSVGCTWLDISGIDRGEGGLRIAMRGVAGNMRAAEDELQQALGRAGVAGARLDFGDVAPILPAGCAALDTFRQVRADSATHLSVPQPRFEMMLQPEGLPYARQNASNAVIDLNLDGGPADFAMIGLEPNGEFSTIVPDRQVFNANVGTPGSPIVNVGNGRYRLNIDLNHNGWSGIILVSGTGPFEPDLVSPPVGSRGPSWQQRFLTAAAQRNWRIEMVWFESVDRVPGDRAPADLVERRGSQAAPPAEEPPPEDEGQPGGDKPTE